MVVSDLGKYAEVLGYTEAASGLDEWAAPKSAGSLRSTVNRDVLIEIPTPAASGCDATDVTRSPR